jgi:hypothetical protein
MPQTELVPIRCPRAPQALRRDVIFRARMERATPALVHSKAPTFDRLLAMASSTPSNAMQMKLQQEAISQNGRQTGSRSSGYNARYCSGARQSSRQSSAGEPRHSDAHVIDEVTRRVTEVEARQLSAVKEEIVALGKKLEAISHDLNPMAA